MGCRTARTQQQPVLSVEVNVVERMIAKRSGEPFRFINHGGTIEALLWPTKRRVENDLAVAAMKRNPTDSERQFLRKALGAPGPDCLEISLYLAAVERQMGHLNVL